jgi:hypothetical protein
MTGVTNFFCSRRFFFLLFSLHFWNISHAVPSRNDSERPEGIICGKHSLEIIFMSQPISKVFEESFLRLVLSGLCLFLFNRLLHSLSSFYRWPEDVFVFFHKKMSDEHSVKSIFTSFTSILVTSRFYYLRIFFAGRKCV